MTGLRERKKQATRKALRDAALRLALEHGVDQVRVADIANAAGVSPRTYNNYFASREQAIVAAVTAEREALVAAALLDQPPTASLTEAVVAAVVQQFTEPPADYRDALLLITSHPALRQTYVETAASMEQPLADAISQRLGGADKLAARVLAAGVAAAVRVALDCWLRPASSGSTLMVPTGSVRDLLSKALEPLAPALAALAASGPPAGSDPSA